MRNRNKHDSGAIYTIGQDPGTFINQNYVRGIPPATGVYQPTYGLHNDEGSAYITENDNVLDIDPGVKYTINCEDYGGKHDLTILRTYATVNKMGDNPPNSTIDPPIVVSDNVWPMEQYNTCLSSGIQDAYRNIIPASVMSTQDFVFPASCAAKAETAMNIRSNGDSSNTVWFAPSGTTNFAEGSSMTKAAGTAISIIAPARNGTYKLFVVNSQGTKIGESSALLRISGSLSQIEAENFGSKSDGIKTEDCSEGGQDIGFIQNESYAVYNNIDFGSNDKTIFQARAACNGDGGSINIRIDSTNGPLIGTCSVTGTGGWQTWNTSTCSTIKTTGKHNVYLVFTGGTGYLFNLNWFEFSKEITAVDHKLSIKKISSFKASVSKGMLFIRQQGVKSGFSVSLFNLDGRLVTRKEVVTGEVAIPVKSKNIFLLNINCNGHIERKKVSSF